MEFIKIMHTIEENKFILNINLEEGTLPLESNDLDITTDIDLNFLIIKLAELIETKRELQIEFIDTDLLLNSSAKVKLIKETLEEIYSEYNTRLQGLVEQEVIVES